MKKNIFLTGGNGFIGRNLQEGLAANYAVFAPRRDELDLLDFSSLAAYVRQHKIDVILHSAVHVPSVHGAEKEYYNDMQMFLNIEKLSSEVEKVLYFGSGAEFDKRFPIRMVKEEAFGKSIPVSEYGLAKYTMNLLAKRSQNIYNLRLFGVFGRYELWESKFLSNLCCKAVFGLPLTIRKDCYFDFLSVEDLTLSVKWFVKNQPVFHDYNVCMGREYSLSTLAKLVREISGKNLPIQFLSDERNLDYSASNERLLAEAPELESTAMEQSLAALYRYYEENKDRIDLRKLERSR